MNSRAAARQILLRCGPRVVAESRWVRARSANIVFRAVDTFVSRGDVALDIGAADGVFSARMLPLVGSRGQVHAFEPNPRRVEDLRRVSSRRFEIHAVALSDRAGVAKLRVPLRAGDPLGGMGSLEGPLSKAGEEVEEVEVPVARLSEVLTDLTRLDFIKCDVEGHEPAVLAGALSLLERFHPTVLIEIEQRHQDRPVADTFALFERLGYTGWAFFPNGLRRVADFDLQRDQLSLLRDDPLTAAPPPKYVNDFLFVSAGTTLVSSLVDDTGVTNSVHPLR